MIGTLVWDRIVPHPEIDSDPGEMVGWGGVGYALSAAAATVPPGWSVLPIVKVGRDLASEADAWLATLPRVDRSAMMVVPEPNNRVTIRYQDAAERTEQLEGGVPPWSWPELAEVVGCCDALLVNFISGHEVSLDTCKSLRAGFTGRIHADLHSLFLGSSADGTRVPRPVPDLNAWLACFDSVQMNEREMGLANESSDDVEGFLRGTVGHGPSIAIVTLGAAGVVWVERIGARTTTGSVTISAARRGDPTGCGDVWGAAFFARRLSSESVGVAAEIATRLATRSVEHRGAEGLYDLLNREVNL